MAIVGAGLGGLTAARVLQQHGLLPAVFDSRPAPPTVQRGSLVMHADSGQAALRTAGLMEQFATAARSEPRGVRLLDKRGGLLYQDRGTVNEQTMPEMNRGELVALLTNSLEPDTVRWNHTVTTVHANADEGYLITFDDQRTDSVDIVIGADGGWSRIRELVSPTSPGYTGVTFVEVWLEDVACRHPQVAALVREGSAFAVADSKGIFAQRQPGDRVRIYIAFRAGMNWLIDGPLDQGCRAVASTMDAMFEDWAPELRSLITDVDDPFIVRPAYALPIPHRWKTTPGVTLIGDAAHLMPPVFGYGANLAMLDGAELGQVLGDAIQIGAGLDEALRSYEKTMLARSVDLQVWVADGLDGAIAPDAPRHTLAHLAHHRDRAWRHTSTSPCDCSTYSPRALEASGAP